MSKPQMLQTITDYRPALLWLMGQLKRAQKQKALAEFEREFGSLIPPDHRQESDGGNVHWRDYYVSRARRALMRAGLLGDSGKGVWTITSVGQKWLAEHPDGGGEALNAYIESVESKGAAAGRKQRVSGQAASRPRSVGDMDWLVEFTFAGHLFRLSGRQVLEQARQALAHGVPPEALRHLGWVVDVDGQPVGAKWLFSLATGLSADQFDSGRARNILLRLGVEPYRQERAARAPLPPRKRGPRKQPQADPQRRHELLDAEISAIQDFLDGRAGSRPTDERLCYWVYLCLALELYAEGWRLFTLIDRSQVQKPLYEYTHRFAEVCQVRAEVQV